MKFKHFTSLPIMMPFFDKDDGSGSGDDPQNEKPEDAEAKKQADLDKQFAERAKRAAEAERKKIFADLGVSDPEEAKKLLEQARKADEANKSEVEKLAEQARKETAAREKAEADAAEKLAAANKRLMDSEIKINAASAVEKDSKVLRPAFRKDALDDVLLLIDRTKIEVDDNGNYKGVDKALEALAKAKPWLLEEKQQPRQGTPRDGGPKPKPGDSGNNRTPIINSL